MKFSEIARPQLEDATRRAALLVHSLVDSDQSWIFSKMLPEEQARLKGLMSELVQLKIPNDRGVLTQALQSSAARAMDLQTQQAAKRAAKERTNIDFFVNLNAESEERLAMVLRNEPSLLIARLFCVQNWAWQQRMLESLPAPQRREVGSLLANSAGIQSGAALEEALLRSLRSRCEGGAVSAPVQLSKIESTPYLVEACERLRNWVSQLRGENR